MSIIKLITSKVIQINNQDDIGVKDSTYYGEAIDDDSGYNPSGEGTSLQ